MTNSQRFKAAHLIAKRTCGAVGDYNIAFSLALRNLYASSLALLVKTKFLASAMASTYTERADKWFVEFKDGSDRTYKHLSGAEELADMLDWSTVAIVDGEPQVCDV